MVGRRAGPEVGLRAAAELAEDREAGVRGARIDPLRCREGAQRVRVEERVDAAHEGLVEGVAEHGARALVEGLDVPRGVSRHDGEASRAAEDPPEPVEFVELFGVAVAERGEVAGGDQVACEGLHDKGKPCKLPGLEGCG